MKANVVVEVLDSNGKASAVKFEGVFVDYLSNGGLINGILINEDEGVSNDKVDFIVPWSRVIMLIPLYPESVKK